MSVYVYLPVCSGAEIGSRGARAEKGSRIRLRNSEAEAETAV